MHAFSPYAVHYQPVAAVLGTKSCSWIGSIDRFCTWTTEYRESCAQWNAMSGDLSSLRHPRFVDSLQPMYLYTTQYTFRCYAGYPHRFRGVPAPARKNTSPVARSMMLRRSLDSWPCSWHLRTQVPYTGLVGIKSNPALQKTSQCNGPIKQI